MDRRIQHSGPQESALKEVIVHQRFIKAPTPDTKPALLNEEGVRVKDKVGGGSVTDSVFAVRLFITHNQ